MKEYPLANVFHLIEPGPVVLVTTMYKRKPNVMTMSWHMMMEFTPPLIGCLLSGNNYSFNALRATKECVIAVPGADIIKTVVDIGNCSGKDTDKFEQFALTARPAKKVRAPLIAGCIANVECRVVDTKLVNKYNFFVLKAVKAWYDPKRKNQKRIHAVGDGMFVLDGRTLDLKKRMTKWTEFV